MVELERESPIVPRLSVIVTAYDRREFLVSALDSLRRQGIPSRDYEVIVLKNFQDEAIDSYIMREGMRQTTIPGKSAVGRMLSIGIALANAPILSFLDDDDMFPTGKLGEVLRRFEADSSLAYYNNGYRNVGPDGRPLGRPEPRYHWSVEGSQDAPSLKATHRRLLTDGAYYHMSSTNVRRSTLLPHLNGLSRVAAMQDAFIYYLALDGGGKLEFSNEVPSLYRIHNSAMHPPQGFPQFVRSMSEWVGLSEAACVELRDAVQSPHVRQLAEGELAAVRTLGVLFSFARNRGQMQSTALRGLRTALEQSNPVMTALAAGLSLGVPRATLQRCYYAYQRLTMPVVRRARQVAT